MPLSYEYSIGSVRAREKSLLSKADLEAMLAFREISSLKAYLKDKGYPDCETVDEMLKLSAEETVNYLNSVVPEPSVFDALIYVNDAHNIKSVIKGILARADYKRLFVKPFTIEPGLIETAVKENKYTLLPEGFGEASKKAYEVLAHTADARLADAYIDSYCMKAQLEKAEETKIAFLKDYLNTEIFYRNVKLALRASITNAPLSYYEAALCSVDGLDEKEVISAALKGVDSLLEYLSTKDAYKCSEAIESYKSSPAEFERFTENLLMQLAIERCRRAGTGAEAAIGYYLASLAQNKAVHIIAVGIETGAEPETTRERLREIYG